MDTDGVPLAEQVSQLVLKLAHASMLAGLLGHSAMMVWTVGIRHPNPDRLRREEAAGNLGTAPVPPGPLRFVVLWRSE